MPVGGLRLSRPRRWRRNGHEHHPAGCEPEPRRSEPGKVRRKINRQTLNHSGTPLFVQPSYAGEPG